MNFIPGTIDQLNKELYDDVIGAIWEAHDDLLDEISACTGWCIRYDHIQENDARRDEELRWSKYTHKRGKVSSLLQRVR